MLTDSFRQEFHCGDDAHDHVAQCPHKTNSDDYFGTTEEFDGAQRRRRIRDLKAYLNEMDADLSKEVLVAIKQDLKDLDEGKCW